MRHVAKKSGRLETGKIKKTIACCSFQRAPPASATRKTEHVSKIKATTITTTTTAKIQIDKSNQQRNEGGVNSEEFERARRVGDCKQYSKKERRRRERIHTIGEQQATTTIRKYCTIRSKQDLKKWRNSGNKMGCRQSIDC
ncbi:hypothetical protein K0M31_015453 [Melipona bicolor]|uniref:Uncharacterized protein n=1 Tax=Melipona bicolor TaxID=60889 RepID=A0AA40FFQ0_9HYME|nr:hypothetical protein K0M31_015453 [Melipona bicolor]